MIICILFNQYITNTNMKKNWKGIAVFSVDILFYTSTPGQRRLKIWHTKKIHLGCWFIVFSFNKYVSISRMKIRWFGCTIFDCIFHQDENLVSIISFDCIFHRVKMRTWSVLQVLTVYFTKMRTWSVLQVLTVYFTE